MVIANDSIQFWGYDSDGDCHYLNQSSQVTGREGTTYTITVNEQSSYIDAVVLPSGELMMSYEVNGEEIVEVFGRVESFQPCTASA